jgi:fumarate reductase flavoprotein subunit
VVIADGGFQANDSMLRRFGLPQPDRCLKRNAMTGVGDGLRMAEEVGAKIIAGRGFYGHLQHRLALSDKRFWPYPLLDVLALEGLVLNGRGERAFADVFDGVALANRIGDASEPDGFMAVFDHAIWMGQASRTLMPPNPFLIRAGGTLVSARTIDALDALVVGTGRLTTTVEDHNRRAAAGVQRAVSSRARPDHVLSTPPFYAVPLSVGITYTVSGIAIDGRARVLAGDDLPIPGLFAAGATTAGLENGPVGGYVGGLSKAAVFGMLAGEQAAQYLRTASAAC